MSQAKCKTGKNKGIDTRVIVHPLTADQMELLGINSGQLIGFSSETITDDSLDKAIAGKIAGSKSYDDTSFTLYQMSGPGAQEDLRLYAEDQIEFNDLWLYYAKKGTAFVHFQALDLASDPCGVFTIAGWSPQSFSRADLLQAQFTLAVNGRVAYYEYHSDDLVWTMADGVITAVDGDFVNQGFRVGMSVIYETGVEATPYGYGLVDALTATTLTLVNTTLELAGGQGKIHGSRIHFKDEIVE